MEKIEDFYIYLTVEGTDLEEELMIVDNPLDSIRNLVKDFVHQLGLPIFDNGENPIMYMFGQEIDDDAHILEFEDEEGNNLTLLDHGIQSGDHLFLISVPIEGGNETMTAAHRPARRSLFQRLMGKRADQVFSSVFVQDKIRRGDSMMIQVYVYYDGEHDQVIWDATHCDEKAKERAYAPLNFMLKKGDTVDVRLQVPGIVVERSSKSFTWQGTYTKVCFHVTIPKDWEGNMVWGEVFLSVNNAILGELDFCTGIVDEYVERKETADVHSRRYKRIFISYAHLDEEKVKYIAEAYKAQRTDYFFDRHYLQTGDVFPQVIQDYINSADLFILCWSENAMKSEYVNKERMLALKLAYPQVQPAQDAQLSIYPIVIEPRAELPSDMRDFYHFGEI